MTAPYAALFYDGKGKTWVYTNPEPLVYVRAPVVVESIKGPNVVLKEGPAAGTTVVLAACEAAYLPIPVSAPYNSATPTTTTVVPAAGPSFKTRVGPLIDSTTTGART